MFLTPAVPRSNNENTNVIAKKTPIQAAARRAFGDIPVNVKNTASPALSKLKAPKYTASPAFSKLNAPKNTASPALSKFNAPKNTASPAFSKLKAPKNTASPALSKLNAPKNTASPAFSKLNAPKIHRKPMPVPAKAEVPRHVVPQFYIRPDEDDLDSMDFPSFDEPEDDYSDIRPVGEMERNIKNLMSSYRDSKTPPPPIQDDWDDDNLELFLEKKPENYYEDLLAQSPPKRPFMEISMPEVDFSF